MNDVAKAWIDSRVDYLRGLIGPLDAQGCVPNPDVDKAMQAAAVNELVNLRERLDRAAPVGYPRATHAYLHDEDLQRLRWQPGIKPEDLNRIKTGAYRYRDESKREDIVISLEDFELLVSSLERIA